MSIKAVRENLYHWMDRIGLGFHPDTRGEDYIVTDTGKPTLSEEEIAQYNAEIDAAFAFCEEHGIDLYALATTEIDDSDDTMDCDLCAPFTPDNT